MRQMSIDAYEREHIKKRLSHVEIVVREMLERWPEFRNTKNINSLVRHIWKITNMDVSCDSISRAARKIRAEHPELDSEENIAKRANTETAYHGHYTK